MQQSFVVKVSQRIFLTERFDYICANSTHEKNTQSYFDHTADYEL